MNTENLKEGAVLMGKSVLVFGSSCVDVIIRVDHLPRTEENLRPSGHSFRPGGCAYNVANILGRGGADVVFVTPVGLEGAYGPYLLPVLDGQPWSHPVLLPGQENGCCYCLVEAGGERTFLSIHGAEYSFSASWMSPYEARSFDYTYVCGFETEERGGEALISWLESTRRGTLFYAPGPRGAQVSEDRTERLFNLHPILHINHSEALQMGKDGDLSRAINTLYEKTGNAVIVTLGPDGALMYEGNGMLRFPGLPVPCVADTIGAGDAHAGAVLLALSRGEPLPQAIAFANRVAAQVVCQEGATLRDDAVLRQ